MFLGSRRRGVALVATIVGILGLGLSLQPTAASRRLPTNIAVRLEAPLSIAPAASSGSLRVCADPNNLPFSNRRGEGFENKIAELAAASMGRHVQYYWQPQRRGFIRSTLRAGNCDVVIGVPASSAMVLTTTPYYRSSYVFVSRRDRHLRVRSLDDPRLKHLRIGVQLTGDDYENPPAAQALAARHLVENVRGYTVYGDYSTPYPQRGPIAAIEDGTVDLAVIWGPVAGYFASSSAVPVEISPVEPQQDGPSLQFAFNIAMAVRQDEGALAVSLSNLVQQKSADIRRILDEYHVPQVRQNTGS